MAKIGDGGAATHEAKHADRTGLTAVEHPDGTFTLQDLPVFGEVAADSNGNKIAATPEWLRAALDRSLKLQEEGFAGPVHVGHHARWDALGQAKDERERIGALVLRDLRPHKVEGKVEQTIFADIADIPADKFARIQKGELPHVSVEYIEEHRPALDSLAITGSACPFKRYANIKVGRIVKAPKATAYTVVTPPAPTALRGITYLAGGNVDEKKNDGNGNGNGGEEKKAPPPAGNSGNQEAQNQNGNAGTEPAAPAWAVAMAQVQATIAQALQAIATKLGASIMPGAPSGPAVLPPTSNAAQVAEAKPAEVPALDAKTFGDLMGRVRVLEGDLASREKAKATDVAVTKFEAQVKGWLFDDKDRAALRATVEAGGEIAAQAFIEQVKKKPKEIANSAADFRAGTSVTPDSPAVMSYVAAGPVKLEQARRFSAMHAQCVAAGLNPSPEEKFIQNQFATEAARANASKGDK